MTSPADKTPVVRLLARAKGVLKSGSGWVAHCPSHDDRTPSLSIREGDDGRVLLKCFAGCSVPQIVKSLGLKMNELFPAKTKGPSGFKNPLGSHTSEADEIVNPLSGLTLAEYAAAKQLPLSFLKGLGLTEIIYFNKPAVRIPYLKEDGTDGPVQIRTALEGTQRFRWTTGSKPTPYGLWRLDEAKEAGHVTLVEGPSDCQTLWLQHIPALGLPSANNWRQEWSSYLDGIPVIYVVIEPDQGGQAVEQWLSTSTIRDRVRLVTLGDVKDPSNLYLANPRQFPARWAAALDTAVPWHERAKVQAQAQKAAVWSLCQHLAQAHRILDTFWEALQSHGVVGEERAAKLIFLALATRVLSRPVSFVVKGPSAAGKSFITRSVLQFLPGSAYDELTAMSERALVYSERPLAHRFLVLYEAAGLASEFTNYIVRSLLSEGRLRYETVEKTKDGLRPRMIEREGPTGLVLTTTALNLHPETETRLFSVTITDTPAQTKAVLRALALGTPAHRVDLSPWHALQDWVSLAEHRVRIPYAVDLAEMIEQTAAVRLRRDFAAILSLVQAHAILHQSRRHHDDDGTIMAGFDDYAAVYELVADIIGEGVEATVPESVQKVVIAITELIALHDAPPNKKAVAHHLEWDKVTTGRWIDKAIALGYLKNREERRGKPAQLVFDDPLPTEPFLPSVSMLMDQVCTRFRLASEAQDAALPS